MMDAQGSRSKHLPLRRNSMSDVTQQGTGTERRCGGVQLDEAAAGKTAAKPHARQHLVTANRNQPGQVIADLRSGHRHSRSEFASGLAIIKVANAAFNVRVEANPKVVSSHPHTNQRMETGNGGGNKALGRWLGHSTYGDKIRRGSTSSHEECLVI